MVSDGYSYDNQVLRAFAVDWAPLGVWRVDVKLKPSVTSPVGATAIQLSVDGVRVREATVAVWLRQ